MHISEKQISLPGDQTLCLLSLHGTLELSTVLFLKTRLSSLLSEGKTQIIIDMSQLVFIDSSGITTLVVGTREAQRRNGSLVIANPSSNVAYTFEITMMKDILEIYNSQEEAIQRFSPQQRP